MWAMGPPKDVRPSFRTAAKTSPTRPSGASLLIAGLQRRASTLHRFARELPKPDLCESKPAPAQSGCLVELSRDTPFALHARGQITLALHRMKHGVQRS